MDEPQNEKPPPAPMDLAGWKLAITDGRLGEIRLEAMVAAIQDLGPSTDKFVLNALAKYLNDAMLAKLRSLVSTSYPNKGVEIIEAVHQKIWEALINRDSADGKGLRVAFIPRLRFRLKDALAKLNRRRQLDEEHACKSPSNKLEKQDSSLDALPDLASFNTASMNDFRLDVEAGLDSIPDKRKCQAFRLWLDGSPFEPTQPNSIPETLDISEKTARKWVAEITTILKSKLGDKL